jgi:hypothetical protein
MTIDTLAYTKALEAAGVDREQPKRKRKRWSSTSCRIS